TAQALGLLLEDVDEEAADDLALLLGVCDPGELAEEEIARVAMDQRDVVVVAEEAHHALPLALAQQAVVDEDAMELLADRLVDQHRGHGGIDAAGEAADDAARADLAADLLDLLLAEGGHGPVAGGAGDAAHEALQEAPALRRVHHLGMEHQ